MSTNMADRDAEQFVRLLARHDREVYRYVLTLLPDRTEADDVLQETAAALWEKFGEYDPDKPFYPWACRFAFFEVLKHRRRVGRSRLRFSEEDRIRRNLMKCINRSLAAEGLP